MSGRLGLEAVDVVPALSFARELGKVAPASVLAILESCRIGALWRWAGWWCERGCGRGRRLEAPLDDGAEEQGRNQADHHDTGEDDGVFGHRVPRFRHVSPPSHSRSHLPHSPERQTLGPRDDRASSDQTVADLADVFGKEGPRSWASAALVVHPRARGRSIRAPVSQGPGCGRRSRKRFRGVRRVPGRRRGGRARELGAGHGKACEVHGGHRALPSLGLAGSAAVSDETTPRAAWHDRVVTLRVNERAPIAAGRRGMSPGVAEARSTSPCRLHTTGAGPSNAVPCSANSHVLTSCAGCVSECPTASRDPPHDTPGGHIASAQFSPDAVAQNVRRAPAGFRLQTRVEGPRAAPATGDPPPSPASHRPVVPRA